MNIEKIVDLNHTISKDFFTNSNVFEVILNLKNYILKSLRIITMIFL